MSGPLARPPAWTEDAACNSAPDPDLFFPESKATRVRLAKARKFCGSCAVLTDCRKRQAETGSQGIWAGQWFAGENEQEKWLRLSAEVADRVRAGESDKAISRMTDISVDYIQSVREKEGLAPNREHSGSAGALPILVVPGERTKSKTIPTGGR